MDKKYNKKNGNIIRRRDNGNRHFSTSLKGGETGEILQVLSLCQPYVKL